MWGGRASYFGQWGRLATPILAKGVAPRPVLGTTLMAFGGGSATPKPNPNTMSTTEDVDIVRAVLPKGVPQHLIHGPGNLFEGQFL
jgi:hypothetical protein